MELPDKPKRLSPSIENLVESIIAERMEVHHQGIRSKNYPLISYLNYLKWVKSIIKIFKIYLKEMAITLQRIKQLEEESRLRNQTYKYLILPIFVMVPFNLP